MELESRRTVRLEPGEGSAVRMPTARLVTRKASARQTGGAYSLFEVEVGPGGGEGPHVQHREDECLCVLEGRVEFSVEDERFEASPGGVVYVPRGALHAFENTGEGTARLLAIQTPGGAHECFVEEAAGWATGGPADTEKLAALGARHGMEILPPPP